MRHLKLVLSSMMARFQSLMASFTLSRAALSLARSANKPGSRGLAMMALSRLDNVHLRSTVVVDA